MVVASVHTVLGCELTAGEADEGQDAAGVAVFTVPAVWRAHLGKLSQEVLGGLLGVHPRRRG